MRESKNARLLKIATNGVASGNWEMGLIRKMKGSEMTGF